MTSIQGFGHSCLERPFVAPSVTFFIASLDSSPPLESGDKLSDQPAKFSKAKPLVNAPVAATNIPKYSKNDLQRIFKAVLEAWASVPVFTPAPAPIPALVISKIPREKLKVCSLDLYRRKSHMECYNFYQQYEDYFATVKVTGPTQILFAVFFL